MDSHITALFDVPKWVSISIPHVGMGRYRWGVVVLVLGSVSDLLTTYVGIEYAGLVEANGTPATILQQGGWMGLVNLSLVSLGIIIGLTALMRYVQFTHSSKLATLYVWGGGAVKLLATAWNTCLILTV